MLRLTSVMTKVLSLLLLLSLIVVPTAMHSQLEFIENQGQWEEQVEFRADIPGGVMWAEKDAMTYFYYGEAWISNTHLNPETESDIVGHAYQVSFVGASAMESKPRHPYDHFYNYYIGKEVEHWASGVHPHKQAKLMGLYPGIDLLLHSSSGALKYDFQLQPQADPDMIVMRYEGLDDISFRHGELVLETAVGEIIERRPFAFQMIEGTMIQVDCEYLLNDDEVRFELGEYDPNVALTIDPEISMSTYIGSVASNFGFTSANDLEGNMLAGAAVFAPGYPTTFGAVQSDFDPVISGNCDVAVSKFSADGSQLLYSTYLGGEGLEMPHSIVVDSEGDYIVMGTTGSEQFPTTPGCYQPNLTFGGAFSFNGLFISASHQLGCDFFLSKFSGEDSGMMASTYVGGEGVDGINAADQLFYNYGDLFRGEVNVNSANEITVASTTESLSFPMVGTSLQPSGFPGFSDGVVFQMSPDLSSLIYSTYLGGADHDAAYAVQFDSADNMIVCGGTRSQDFPIGSGVPYQSGLSGQTDSFVIKFNPGSSAPLASTFYGTPSYDQAYFVQLDVDENIYLYGQSNGGLEVSPNCYGIEDSGQYVAKFNSNLSVLEWNTVIGTGDGEIDISPTGFLVSDCYDVYISGWGGVTNANSSPEAFDSSCFGLPVTGDAFQPDTDGSDFYLAVLTADAAQLKYATFFGGDESNEHVDGGTSRYQKDGTIYQAVCAGCGGNSDFPTTPSAWSDTNPSGACNLGVFTFDLGTIDASLGVEGPDVLCEDQEAQFINESFGGDQYIWNFGDDNSSTEFEPLHIYEDSGIYEVELIVYTASDCLEPDTTYLQVEILEGVYPEILPVDPICDGATTTMTAIGSENGFWEPNPAIATPDQLTTEVTPTEPSTFFFTDVNECESETVEVFVDYVQTNVEIGPQIQLCEGESAQLSASGGVTYSWSPSESVNDSEVPDPIATPAFTTTYQVLVTTIEGCEVMVDQEVVIFDSSPGGMIYPEETICLGSAVQLNAEDGFAWDWSPTNGLSNPSSQAPFASPETTTTYEVLVTNICGSGTDQVTVNVIIPQTSVSPGGEVCFGEVFTVSASGGESYLWQPSQFVANPQAAITAVSPPEDLLFTVTIIDEFGCNEQQEVMVEVLPLPDVYAGPDQVVDVWSEILLQGSASGTFWWTESEFLSCTDCLSPAVFVEEPSWFELNQIDENGCTGKDSVFVDVFFPVYVPNAFTPNNDGINDIFFAKAEKLINYRMEIHDRWGELIFASEDPNEVWDGSVNRGEYFAQSDVYVWTLWYETLDGPEQLQGHVTLVR